MKKYWKRFAGWVTGLKSDPFDWAHIKLTAFYTITIVIVFVVANITLFGIWSSTVVRVMPGIADLQTQNELSQQLEDELGKQSGLIYLIIVSIILSVSSLIGSRTLLPIRNIVRAQKRFISDASHELRTPLAIMRTNAEIVLIDGNLISVQEAQEALKSNLEEVERMSKIIDNLLALSFYDNRFKELPREEVELSKIIIEVTEKSKSLIKNKTVNLRLLETDAGIIMANKVAIEEMALNLIKNAIKYTLDGGQVSISVVARRSTIEFKVKDTGIGIEKKDFSSVFNPFYKAGEGRIQLERDSSGLGLTIVKRIVELHDGSIYLNSAVGKGTTIVITFPLHRTGELLNSRLDKFTK
ncbi:MAG: HAMP domain-containing sensor histidine kinase [Patescibacteria group bacterium]